MQKFTNHFHYKYEKIEKICEINKNNNFQVIS